jgi:hypothetical protein
LDCLAHATLHTVHWLAPRQQPPLHLDLSACLQPLRDAVTAATQALASAWFEVEEEFGRINARLPSHAPVLAVRPPRAGAVLGH